MKTKRENKVTAVTELPDNEFNRRLKRIYDQMIADHKDFRVIFWHPEQRKWVIYV